MKYEELITELCEVIKETENDSISIFNNIEDISKIVDDLDMPIHKREKIEEFVSNIFGLLQRQDLHRQTLEKVVNFVCDNNNIDKSQYNFACSGKTIYAKEDSLNADELEELIKSMQ
ncbi:hypothetical protein ACNSOS_10885 [Aliarcobacter vitoriensis]|uniref:Uncharacterized protein n=1 Tax=Aliarcobacter vitoriensis TaxID=2011099 RepID=A0A366MTT6_9BACT|nr:hypothetical protein [Aliarcobacter vitoriensis]RBQ29688.1 hypothetical protein CRU91_03565 [Aliarcobacter vitoriensis]RBQ30591.1 hypothetical protein CRU92_11240 [Arcobacter sp. FW59]